MNADILSRVEDAGLNASAPPQQRWVDGWLVRASPGKAKRARCINAVATGRLPLQERLAACASVLREAGLPLLVRITPFSQPPALDGILEAQGMGRIDDTRVMIANALPHRHDPFPAAWTLEHVPTQAFAEQIGALRGSPPSQRAAHAERLALSPVPYRGWVVRQRDSGRVGACGQIAIEGPFVGLYDVFTNPEHRGQGLARALCAHLLAEAGALGASVGYLQVDSDNAPARAIYHRLGFADAYAYHYRSPDADAH